MFKIPLPSWAIRQASRFLDIESSGETAVVDNRIHEYAFVLSEIAKIPVGTLIDVGCAARLNTVPAFACRLGWKVYGLDKRIWTYKHDNFHPMVQDIDKPFNPDIFNVVVALSTVEHIGMAGRYGIRYQNDNADIEALENLYVATKKGGTLLLTVPYTFGDYEKKPLGRVYDNNRLSMLLLKWSVIFKEVTPDKSTILIKAVKL